MTAFEHAIEDIFNVPEFRETFRDEEGEKDVVTIAYSIDTAELYTEYGVDAGVSFYLTCKVRDYTPKRGNRITFRNTRYRVSNYHADSFNLTYNIFLKSLTSK